MDFTKYFADTTKTCDIEKFFEMMESAVTMSTAVIPNESARNAMADVGRANINLVRVLMTAGQDYANSMKKFTV